jgi:hypothetical protein
MKLTTRVERLEDGAGMRVCPCHTPKLITHVEIDEADIDRTAALNKGGCELCGSPLPISQIVTVIPRGARRNERVC